MSNSNTMGVASLKALLGAKTDFQRNYLWEVIFGYDVSGITGTQIGKLAQECYFGEYNFEPNILRVGPYESHYSGLLEVQNIVIKFLKPSPDILTTYLTAWRNLIVDTNTGLFGVKSAYQKNVYIRFLDTQGNVINSYKCVGAFPVLYPFYNLNYKASTLAETQIQFAVDKIEYQDATT
jgi:hypothetical protein